MEPETQEAKGDPGTAGGATKGLSQRYGPINWAGLLGGAVVFFLLLPTAPPEGLSVEGWHTALVAILMAVWWMTEALPIPATALLPIVLLPLLGVGSVEESTQPYAHPFIFLFMGGFMIALAMQRWGLNRRIALTIINLMGTKPTSIVAGFMASSALISLWVSNTAATLVLLPVAFSVIELVPAGNVDGAPREDNFTVTLLLGLAYAASIGGLGSLIGTPTNGLVVAFVADQYGVEISFLDWLAFGLPFVAVAIPLSFLILTKVAYPVRMKELPGGRELIVQGLREIGPISRPELSVLVVFGLTAVLWIIRPLLVPLLPELSDTGIAIFGALLLFIIPVDLGRGVFVLNWEWASRLPWGVLILFGGGLSLANAISRTGLAEWIGSFLTVLSTWPTVFVVVAGVALVIFMTELASNSATAAAFLPVLASVAVSVMHKNPLMLLVPATLAASCAFMLPVGTPPNAIVYGSNRLTIRQMAKAGLYLNFAFIAVITIALYVLIGPVLGIDFGTMPSWAEISSP